MRATDDDGATLGLPGIIPPRRKPKPKARTTWLSPYLRAYRETYGMNLAPVAMKRLARAVRPLEQEHGPGLTEIAFRAYCRATSSKFYSAERFAETFPYWRAGGTGGRPDPLAIRPGESLDAYEARLAAT